MSPLAKVGEAMRGAEVAAQRTSKPPRLRDIPVAGEGQFRCADQFDVPDEPSKIEIFNSSTACAPRLNMRSYTSRGAGSMTGPYHG